MPAGAVALLVVLSVESFKASSRYLHKRKSRKHGYSSLRTDSLGRPLSEDGKRLSKNEAKALAAHNKEIERIRTAEREWRAKGERLPAYGEMSDDAIIQSLRSPGNRPRTAPGNIERQDRPRISGFPSAPSSATIAMGQEEDLAPASATGALSVGPLDGGAFSIRRRTQTLVLPSIPSTNETPEIEDILQNDGLDWRRATWESPPMYIQESVHQQPAMARVATAQA